MATAAYGATNPAGTDPWPIETVLAKEALSGNPSAHMMLSNYQQAREADTNLYNLSMEGQHAFARQQLAQQMAEARMKAIPDYLSKPGGGAFLAGGGLQGVGPGDGGNAAAWAGLGQAGQQHDFAANLAETGKGVESLSRAGQDVAIQQIPGLQNFHTTGAGEHSDISVEKIKAATSLQTAAMHAKAKGGVAEGSFSAQLPTTAETGDMAITARSAKNEPFSHFVSRLQAATPSQQRVSPPSDGPTPATPSGAQQRRSAGTTTSLAPAPTTGRVANAAPGADPIQRGVQSHLENVVRTQNPAAYADIMAKAKMNGGAVQLGKDARGQVVVQGVRGTYQ